MVRPLLFQNTIIPIQVTLFGMHHYSHDLPTDYNSYSANLPCWACMAYRVFQKLLFLQSVKVLGMLQPRILASTHYSPLIELEVDIERLLFSLVVKMPNFCGPKKDKKGSIPLPIVWFLWKLQSSHLISYHCRWWMFGWYLICRNMSTDYVWFWKSIHAFKKHTFFVWIYSQLQILTMLHVGITYHLQ